MTNTHSGNHRRIPNVSDEQQIDRALQKLKPQFGWIKGMKSLAIQTKDSSEIRYSYNDCMIRKFLLSLMEFQKESRSLERLLINKDDIQTDFLDWFMTGPTVKSFVLQRSNFWLEHPHTVLFHERFRELEHLANISFTHRLEFLTELKYVLGRCGEDIQVFPFLFIFTLTDLYLYN